MKLHPTDLRTLCAEADAQLAAFMGTADGSAAVDEAIASPTGSVKSPSSSAKDMGRRRSSAALVKAETAEHKNTWRFVSLAIVKFAVPIVLVACWVVSLFLLTQRFAAGSLEHKYRAVLSVEYSAAYLDYHQSTLAALVGVSAGPKPDVNAELARFEARLSSVDRTYKLGGAPPAVAHNYVSPVDPSTPEYKALYVDACPYFPQLHRDAATGECRGAITLGVVAAGQLSAHSGRLLRTTVQNSTQLAVSAASAAELGRAKFGDSLDVAAISNMVTSCAVVKPGESAQSVPRWVKDASDAWTGALGLSDMFVSDIVDHTDAFKVNFEAIIAVFVVCFLLMTIGLALSTVSDVRRVLRLSVTLILMLPGDIMFSNDAIKAQVMQLTKTH